MSKTSLSTLQRDAQQIGQGKVGVNVPGQQQGGGEGGEVQVVVPIP